MEREADIVIRLLDPEGRLLAKGDGPGPPGSQELLVAVTQEAGLHQVLVELKNPSRGSGHYALRYLAQRPAETADATRILGMRAFMDGKQLDVEGASLQQRETARAFYAEAIEDFSAIGDDNYLAWSLVRAATVDVVAERWGSAEALSRRAVDLFSALGHEEGGLSSALTALAQTLGPQERYEEALAAFDRALAAAQDRHGKALNFNNRGTLFLELGDFERAKEDFSRALSLWRRAAEEGVTDALSWQVLALINLGVAHRKSGELLEALHRYEEAAVLAKRYGNRSNQVHLASNLGRYYIATGELQKALDTLLDGLELAREQGNLGAERAITSNLGLLYSILGRPDRARDFYNRHLGLARSNGEPTVLAASLLALGQLDSEEGHVADSLQRLEEALRWARKSPSTPLQATVLRNLAQLKIDFGEASQARTLIDEARHLAGTDSPYLSASLRLTDAEALRALGRIDEAAQVLESALDPTLRLDNPLMLATLYVRSAEMKRQQNHLEEAQNELESALDLHEILRSRVVDPELRATFLARRYDWYLELVSLRMEMETRTPGEGKAARALAAAERMRARTLVELLTESQTDVRQRISDDLKQREKTLALRLALLQSELIRATGGARDEETDLQTLRSALDSARRDQQALATEIREQWSAYASLNYPQPLELGAIQELVPPRDALLYYVLAPQGSFLFVIGHSSFAYFDLPPADRITAAVSTFRDRLLATDPRTVHRSLEDRASLYQLLVQPAEPLLDEVDRLWIAPDGPLFYVPFETLLRTDPSTATQHPLLTDWVVGYVPSASALASLARTADDFAESFVAFAGPVGSLVDDAVGSGAGLLTPLPGTVQEVRSIARLFPLRSKLYLGPEANQDNLFGNPVVEHARFLHFASHGLISEAPSDSAILLSPDLHGDTLLHVSEVFNLHLEADVVVLSACETGLGENLRGEGLVGLSRAFFYAGSRNLVVSLWPIADRSTSTLMNRFYAHLAAGLLPPDALRRAKLDLISDSSFRSPRYWAPFVLIGAPAAENVTAPGDGSPEPLRTTETRRE